MKRSNDVSVRDCLREARAQAHMPEVAGKQVLVKPNLIDYIEPYPTARSGSMFERAGVAGACL